MLWILIYDNRISTYENRIIRQNMNNDDVLFLDPNYIQVLIDKDGVKYFYKKTEIEKPKTVWIKLGCMLNEQVRDLSYVLKDEGVSLVNDYKYLEIVSNKFLTANILKQNNIDFIRTLKVKSCALDIVSQASKEFEYPLILKSKVGSLGMGIYKIDSEKELINMVEQISLLDKEYEYLLQDYIEEASTTFRVVVLGGQIKYVIKNVAQANNFKSNYSQNNELFLIDEIDSKMSELVQNIYAVIPLNVMGIDLILNSDGSYKVCEINSNPGFKGINSLGHEAHVDLLEYIKGF